MVEKDWKKMVENWKSLKKCIVFIKEQYSKTKVNREKVKSSLAEMDKPLEILDNYLILEEDKEE